MAKKKRKKKTSTKRRIRGVSGRFQKTKAKKQKGQIPLVVLKKRLDKLASVVARRRKKA